MEPLAARLSPAAGPAAAMGDSGTTVNRQKKKMSRWKSTDTRRPVRQMDRSRRLRSLAVISSIVSFIRRPLPMRALT